MKICRTTLGISILSLGAILRAAGTATVEAYMQAPVTQQELEKSHFEGVISGWMQELIMKGVKHKIPSS